jgi:DNA-binding transcriptional LysR family regulator
LTRAASAEELWQWISGACSCALFDRDHRSVALTAAASQILAAQTIVATVDSAYAPDVARQLLGRETISVEAFLRERRTVG